MAARVTLRSVTLFVLRSIRRLAVTIVGALLILLGVVMIVTPGPGWLTIFAGLGVLSTEYTWARRALVYCKERYGKAKNNVKDRRRRHKEGKQSPPSTDV